jgi:hypothetical protein
MARPPKADRMMEEEAWSAGPYKDSDPCPRENKKRLFIFQILSKFTNRLNSNDV